MSCMSRELYFLILQYLDEHQFTDAIHELERESACFFNMRYFAETVINGEWDKAEKYLSGFTKVDDNGHSRKIFFEMRKYKYLEALDKQDRSKAKQILMKDLKVFSTFNEDLFKDLRRLLTLGNIREHEDLSEYQDAKSERRSLMVALKRIIEANPVFKDKLEFPSIKKSRLETLLNQSLTWQHQLCKNPKHIPEIKTLFVDHTCDQSSSSMPKLSGFPLSAHGPCQAYLMESLGLTVPSNAVSRLKRPRSPPNNTAMDSQTANSEDVLKRARPFGTSEEGK